MFTRRDFLTVAAATAILTGAQGRLGRLAAAQRLSQDDLLAFEPLGQVTLLHVTDIHAQLKPIYFREPTVNLGVGEVAGLPPHITGKDFLKRYDIAGESAEAPRLAEGGRLRPVGLSVG